MVSYCNYMGCEWGEYICKRSIKNSVPSTGSPCTGTNLTIGAENAGRQMNGYIDQVKIFNYARTPAQIVYDYNRGAPIAHWKFDECQGITANDSSGNGNSGTITIGATVPQSSVGTCTVVDTATAWYNGATGKYNASLNFDGVDDYVYVADNDLWNFGNNDFSIGMWAKFNSVTGTMDFIGQSNGGGTVDKWMIGYNYSATNQISFHMNGSTIKDINANWAASTGRWYHIVLLGNLMLGNFILMG